MEQFKDRLKQIIGEKSVRSFAAASKISGTQMGKYLKGASPSLENVISIANAAGVNIEWLATGHGSTGLTFDNQTSVFADTGRRPKAPATNFIGIPLLNLTASAGDGRLVLHEDQTGYVHFDESWLRSTYHINPAELFSLQAVGESMEPTIKPGEFLLVSTNEQHAKPGDGIYVIRIDGNILVKRLQVMPGKIKVSSDNAAMYQSYDVDLNKTGDFAVLGKVLLVHGLRRI